MAAPPSTPPAQRPASRSNSPSPSPATNTNADATQTPHKRSLRQRMGTAVRRSSSFLIPSRPTTPAVGSASMDDPFLVASSPNASPTPAPRTGTGTERGRSSSPAPGAGAANTMKRILGRKASVDRLGSTPPSQTGTVESQSDTAKETTEPNRTPTKGSRPASVRSVERQTSTAGVPLYMADTASTAARRASKEEQEKEKDNKPTSPTPLRERTSSESGSRRRKMSLSGLSLRSMRTKSSGPEKGAQVVPPATAATTAATTTTTTAAAPIAAEGQEGSTSSVSPPIEMLSSVPENARTSTQTNDVHPTDATATPTTFNTVTTDDTPETESKAQSNGEEPESKTSGPMLDGMYTHSPAASIDNFRHDHQLAQVNGHAEYTPQLHFADIDAPSTSHPSSEGHDHTPAPSIEGDSVSGSEEARPPAPAPAPAPAHPRMLAVRTSLDDLHESKDLSPIPEDARSAEEERAYNQQAALASQPAKPSALATVSPVIAADMSVSSDGTTPRPQAFPQPGMGGAENGQVQVPVREQKLEEAEGYFAAVAPTPLALPVPVIAANERHSLDDPFKDPESAISARYVGFPPGPGSSQPSLDTVPPAMPAPAIISQPVPETVHSMPIPNPYAPEVRVQDMGKTRDMPTYRLPELDEVTNNRELRTMPSDYTLAARSSREASVQEVDESAPLLPRSKRDEAEIDIFGNRAAPGTARTYGSHRLSPSQSMLNGWVAHALPDASTYYTHPELRLTTDVDLSDAVVREALARYVEETTGGGNEASVPEGWEVWVHDEALIKGRAASNVTANLQSQQKKHADGRNKGRKAEREMKKDVKGKAPSGGWREISGVEAGKNKDEVKMNPVRCWVNHGARAMGYWPPPTFGMNGSAVSLPVANTNAAATTNSSASADDALDHAYRYWIFMETHPAHAPLPKKAYTDALDALTWSYTEMLLKTQRRVPPPFSQQEAQKLLTVLRNTRSDTMQDFGNADTEFQAPNAVQTRVVSRILRRVVQWRQHFFRPEKPLPYGTSSHPLLALHSSNGHVHFSASGQPQQSPRRGGEFGKTALDVVFAWLCLGIPYLYANRHLYASVGRFDEEGGALVRSIGPTLVVGVAIFVVAALILLGALFMLFLPGLDPAARTAALVAAVGAVASLLAAFMAVGRGSVEAQRALVHELTMGGTTSGEGRFIVHHHHPTLSLESGVGTVVLSLPAVFLAYATLALLAGLVLYVFRGNVPTPGGGSGAGGSWTRVASYTRWTTVGVLGFCGGLLATSMIGIRR